ncbi:LysR family transcriptional regulator [Novispirillum sp. DQ9]|uniref:LysR family transcriptional regulator n=1 Tax=Novispirillum sp. DQ9 TaxID=3398612 RepID=UPI003C7C6B6C
MDRLSGMAVFVRVVEEGGFSAAARALGLSKSAVSKQVSALEERLGARLLNRTTRRLALTDAGTAFHERAVRILADAEEAEAAVSQLSTAPRGVLRINAPVTFGIQHLGPLLPEFMAAYPELVVEVTLNDRFVDLVEEGFDVAVRIGRLADSSLIARRLAPVRRLVVASPAYVAAHGAPETPEDLRHHACLHYTYLLRGDVWSLTGTDGRTVDVRVAGRLRANNGDVLRSALLAGLGIAYTPSFIVGRDVAEGRLVRLLPGWEDISAAVYAVHPHARLVPPKVRAFVDYLAQRFAGHPEWDLGCP